jgi:hypothetical protein
MKNVITTALLTVLMLNAGAFASDNRAYLRNRGGNANITVVTKNQAWPVRTQMTLEPCSLTACVGA